MVLRHRVMLTLILVVALVVSVNGLAFGQAEPEGKLAEIIARGKLVCGIAGSLPGFSFLDPDTGEVSGFDADYCRAVTAAIFGEVTADNLEFVPLTANERFTALQAGQVDVLFRNTTWTFSRDTDLDGEFGPVTFYDGQGLMVPADLGVSSINDLDGSRICTQSGTTTELNITDAMSELGFTFELVPLETSADTMTAFEAGSCDVLTSDKSQLAALRGASANPSLYTILPDTLSKEPLGPMWIEGDGQFGDVIKWTVYATFHAEEFGYTQGMTAEEIAAVDPRFAGAEGDLGSFIGLSNNFAVNVITAVGNYGEIYSRNLDALGIGREGSLNAMWTNGGLIYAPAWR